MHRLQADSLLRFGNGTSTVRFMDAGTIEKYRRLGWRECSAAQFAKVLERFNYRRDGWANAIRYHTEGSQAIIGIWFDQDGVYFLNPQLEAEQMEWEDARSDRDE